MKRITLGLVLLVAITIATGASAGDKTYFGFQIGVGHAPPPPQIVYITEPRMERYNRSRVMILSEDDPGYDMFRYGPTYYVNNDGYWYRGRTYRGPFISIDARRVPRQVYSVPAGRWRHHPKDGGHGHMNGDRGHRHGQGNGKERKDH